MKGRTWLAICLIALVMAAAMWLARPTGSEPPVAAAAAPQPAIARIQPRPLRSVPAVVVPLSDEDRQFARQLRERFGLHLGDKHAQIRLVEQVLAYLEAHGLARDLDHAYALLKEMFPELADALFAKLQGLLTYDDWLGQTREQLAQLPAADRREALWSARRQIFGDDATEIWAGELRSEQLRTSLDALESQPQLTTHEKLDRYVAAIQEAYGDRAPDVIGRSQTELLDQFMTLQSVQEDLAAMAPDQRRETLHQIRGTLGMDDAALRRWDDLDRTRDQAWDAGQQYLRERQQLALQFPAVEQDQRLRDLQDRLFGAEAETIRAEEAAGFFRFRHPRRIGHE